MKSSLISYHTTSYKALALPDENPVVFDDVVQYQTGAVPELATRVEMQRRGDQLCMKVLCFDSKPVNASNTPGCASVWSGDILEIFFGAIAPEPWQLQLCVGAGGGRFDSQGRYEEWSAETVLTSFGWQADIRIPFHFLRLQDLSVGFNICRQSPAHGEEMNWSVLKRNFHEAENYGELFFCDYNTAFLAKTGTPAPKTPLTRAEFEAAVAAKMIPAWQVVHGPFLLNPDCGRISISWNTAGMCGALLEYREQGSSEWLIQPADEKNGILEQSHSIHRVELEGLKPGGRYEYRLKSIRPVAETLETFPADGSVFSFTVFSPERMDFSFGLCSDLHSNEMTFRRLLELPQTAETDFWVMLGDLLSHASGPEACYDGFLDTAVRFYAAEKPLVFVRGNHEQIGLFASDYSLMGHFSGHTWYMFRQGKTAFIVLDAGNDHPDEPGQGIHRNDAMTREEARWLDRAVRCDLWKNASFRLALIHIPPFRDSYDSNMTMRLIHAFPADVPGIDLMFSGHVHKYFRLMPDGFLVLPLGGHRKLKNPPHVPFPVIANDTCTGLFVEVASDSVIVTARKTDGSIVDSFRICRHG